MLPYVKIYLLCTCFVLCIISCRHNPKVLQTQAVPAEDSIRIFRLFDIATDVQNTNPDSAYHILQEAGKLADTARFGYGIMNYYNYAVYNRCAFASDYELAKKIADSSMQYAALAGNEPYKMSANFTLGMYYQSRDEQDSAIKYYIEALRYQPLTQDSSKLDPIYNNLAILFNYEGRYAQAIEYQKKSLNLYLQAKDTDAVIGYYNNMYRHYLGAKDTAAADTSIRKGLAISKMQARWASENEMFNCLGDMYLSKGMNDSAIYYYTQHLNFTKQLYAPIYFSQPYVSLAKAYVAKNDYTTAAHYLQLVEGLVNPDELPLFSRKDYYETAYKIAVKNKNDSKALSALENLNGINEIFLKKQSNVELKNYDRQVKELEKEKATISNQLQIKQKNNWITILAMGCILLVVSGLLSILYWRKKKTAESEKLEKLKLETEWQQLKSRMEAQSEERNRISQELHDDLGATLTSISLAASLLQEQQPSPEVDIIARSSSDMATRMNEIVWSLNTDNDNLQSLVAYIRKFCNTFLKDAGIRVVFTEKIEDPHDEIKGFIRRNVFHTVKEAINNIVKHAQASEVSISVEADNKYFYIIIADNGKGIKNVETQSWNNGLRNMQKNISHIKGSIKWLMQNGTIVSIKTPLKI